MIRLHSSHLSSVIRSCSRALVMILAFAVWSSAQDANEIVSVSKIEPVLRALQERYHAVTNQYLTMPNSAPHYPTDGFYNGVTVGLMNSMINDAISQCRNTAALYRAEDSPDSPFLEMPDAGGAAQDQALRTALEWLGRCRYVHIGPGGLSVPLKAGEVRHIDISRNAIHPPLDVEWFNAGYTRVTAGTYDKKQTITTDDSVRVLSMRTIGEIVTGINGGGILVRTEIGTGFEYGFSITYDLTTWNQAPARPFYSITWYSGLGNTGPTTPMWPVELPSDTATAPVHPPFWITDGYVAKDEERLQPWIFARGGLSYAEGGWPAMAQRGPIRTSAPFPGPSITSSNNLTITSNMDYDVNAIGNNWKPGAIWYTQYFYQIDYHGLILDMNGRFVHPIPPAFAPLNVAAIYPGGCPSSPGVITKGNSVIDNGSMTYYHDAWDYYVGSAPGCEACGGAVAGGAGTVELAVGRIHRYRDLDWGASFGPGVVSNHDLRLQLYVDAAGARAGRFFDPLQRTVCEFTGSSGSAVLRDTGAIARSLTLYAADQSPASDIALARRAVLDLMDGRELTFELFAMQRGDATAINGRVIRVEDESGHRLVYAYVDSDAQAAMADATVELAALWRYQTITDQRGVSANFSWVPVAGQWAIATATMPGGGVFTYGYGGNGLVALSSIAYPTGEASTFTPGWKADEQWVSLTMSDAGAESSHRRKTVYLTPSIETGLTMSAQAQLPNLVRQVNNGSGELSYRNWPEAHGDTLDFYHLTGGGADGAGVLSWVQYQAGRPVAAKTAVQYFPGQSFATHEWTVDSSYTTDARMRPMAMTDPTGTTTTYERDGRGNITARIFRRPDGSEISRESTTWDDRNNPLIQTDALGRVTRNAYNADGLLTHRTVAVGTSNEAYWEYDYDEQGRLKRTTDANRNATDYAYDPITGQITSIIEPNDNSDTPADQRPTRNFTYDAAGRPLTSSDASGRTVTYDYDKRGRPTVTTYSDHSTEEIVYGTGADANLVIKKKNRNDYWDEFDYDGTGRSVSAVYNRGKVDQLVREWVYVPGRDLIASETVNGKRKEYTYDGKNRNTGVTVWSDAANSHTQTSEIWEANNVSITIDDKGRRSFSLTSIDQLRSRSIREVVAGAVTDQINFAQGDQATLTETLWNLERSPEINPSWIIDESAMDVAGQTTVQSDARGIMTKMSYDSQGRSIGQIHGDLGDGFINPNAVYMAYGYDAQGNRTKTINPRSFTRNADGTFSVNPAGEIATVTTYTGRNLVASVTEAVGTADAATVYFKYSPTGQKVSETDPRNPQWTTIYSYGTCCDRAAEIQDAKGFFSRITHDNKGNRTASINALGHGTFTEYDAQDRPVKVWNSENEESKITYDDDLTDGVGLDALYSNYTANLDFGPGATGSAVLTTNPALEKSLKISDSLGRTRRTVGPDGSVITISYLILSNGLEEILVTDSLGQVMRQRKDAAGRVLSIVDNEGNEAFSTYDANGNVLSMRDANGVGYDAEYDEFNRQRKSKDTAGSETKTKYDAQGNPTEITDARGQTVYITYDARARKATTTERINVPPTKFTYDKSGNVTSIMDAEGKITRYEFDERGLLVSEAYPIGQQTSLQDQADSRSYTYDDARRLLTRTDQAGVVTTYGYDNASRMLSRTATDGSADAFVYDDAGRMTTATSGQYRTSVQRFYNSVGQLDHEIQDLGGTAATVNYRYDIAGRPTHVIYPDGRIVARAFTARGQLHQVWLGDDSVAIRDYDAAGRLKTTTLRNGLTESRTYQPNDNLLATLSVASASSASAVSFAYDFDQNKRKTKETANHAPASIAQRFDYDNADRLIAWTKGGDSQQWDLSPVGDWNTTTRNGVIETRDHTPVHEVTRLSVPGQVTDLVYDTKGNLTRDTNGASYTWDAENRLISASIHSVSTRRPELSVDGRATYRYDALGRRLQKTIFGRTTTFVHDGDQIIQETDGTPSVAADSPQANDDGTGAGDPPGGALIADALVRVNFQPATAYIPDGFVADKGRALGLRTNGKTYGWETAARPSDHAVIRGVYPYPQWDTHQRSVDGTAAAQTNAGTWKIAVENGTYAVALVMGDPITMNQTNDVTINGVTISDLTPAVRTTSSTLDRGNFDGYAVTATVTDGFITIAVPSSAQDSKLCFLEIGAKGTVADNALKQKVSDAVAKANRLTDQDFPPQNASPRVYVYGSYVDEPLAMETGSGANARRYYLHANHLYSIAALSDSTGAVVERYQYDAMGQRTILAANGITVLASSAYGNQIGFTGRYHDDETGLQYFRSRMYSASLGRFISRDSAGYVNGTGLYGAYFIPNMVDPSGYVAQCADDEIGEEMMEMIGLMILANDHNNQSALFGSLEEKPSIYQASMTAYQWMGMDPSQASSRALMMAEVGASDDPSLLDPMTYFNPEMDVKLTRAYAARAMMNVIDNAWWEIPTYGAMFTGIGSAAEGIVAASALTWRAGSAAARTGVAVTARTATNIVNTGVNAYAVASNARSIGWSAIASNVGSYLRTTKLSHYAKRLLNNGGWPLADGFGTASKVTMKPGMLFDRFAENAERMLRGKFAGRFGDSLGSRSLREAPKLYQAFEVVKQFPALSGRVFPWFFKSGGGGQFRFGKSVGWLLDNGYIKKFATNTIPK